VDHELPCEATVIDLALAEVGISRAGQVVVFGRVFPESKQALVVAQLIAAHEDGIPGHYYGCRLSGTVIRGVFRPWSAVGLGEMCWTETGWVQASVDAA